MTIKIGAGLYQNYNAWYVRKMIRKELRIYFDNKRYLFKNLETASQVVAVGRAEPIHARVERFDCHSPQKTQRRGRRCPRSGQSC